MTLMIGDWRLKIQGLGIGDWRLTDCGIAGLRIRDYSILHHLISRQVMGLPSPPGIGSPNPVGRQAQSTITQSVNCQSPLRNPSIANHQSAIANVI
jgi:hypothetical protein